MTLKVEGSNPFTYPIEVDNKSLNLWQIIPNDFEINSIKIHNSFKLSKLITIQILLRSWNSILLNPELNLLYWDFLINSFNKKNKYNRIKINFIKSNFKIQGYGDSINKNFFNNLPQSPQIKIQNAPNNFLHKNFKTYLRTNISSNNPTFQISASFKSYYIGSTKGGSAVFNVSKLFNKWKLSYYLFFNLFHYKIKFLTFTPSFFKKEVLSLTWKDIKQISFLWRYIKPFLVYKQNKINDDGEFIFRKIKFLGFNIACISDISYHNKTIYYLRRLNFYTIGLVPTIYHKNTLDFAIPTSNSDIIAQLFFIRTLLVVKQTTLSQQFHRLKSYWLY